MDIYIGKSLTKYYILQLKLKHEFKISGSDCSAMIICLSFHYVIKTFLFVS